MTWYLIVLLIISGILTGFINTLAGGGSVISLSVFMMLGLPPQIANGTNRIGILFQTLFASGSFRHYKVFSLNEGTKLAIPAVIGSIIGAQLAVDINKEVFNYVIAFLLLFIMVMMFIKPAQWIKGNENLAVKKPGWVQMLVFFGIGFYGGFIQVGVGYFLIAGIVLGAGYNLVKANAIKGWIMLLFTAFALIIFVINKQVIWSYGLIHAIGNVVGALVGSRLAVKKGTEFVRWVIVIFTVITAADLFGMINLKNWLHI
ncbi:MAG: sulfite exporter TauE/SafE family protein [Bacteroidales bacterium]|jgi:uncharacterized membrane protein YfcA|nr:sulfite exporter TauE/SafE family protein [Bacteroidales bacterium]